MLLSALAANAIGNMLAGKRVIQAGEGAIARTRYDQTRVGVLIPFHPLTTFEIRKSQNETTFNDFNSRNNLPKIKDGV